MRRPLIGLRLNPAERARTVVASATNLRLESAATALHLHRHAVTPDGTVLFQAPAELADEVAQGVRATATLVDVTTVPQPDRVRGTLTLVGSLHTVVDPLPAGMRLHLTGSDRPEDADPRTLLLRLVPDTVGLAWRCETRDDEPPARQVPLEEYRRALPDPLLAYEATWLPHLQADHADVLVGIARHELGWNTDPDDVRALGIDRYGLVLRVVDGVFTDGRPRDLRVGFDRPVTCGCDVREAVGALLARAVPGTGPVC